MCYFYTKFSITQDANNDPKWHLVFFGTAQATVNKCDLQVCPNIRNTLVCCDPITHVNDPVFGNIGLCKIATNVDCTAGRLDTYTTLEDCKTNCL